MKRILAAGFLFLLMPVFIKTAFADILDSKHNLSSSGTMGPHASDGFSLTCGFCHIPHGIGKYASVYMWGRDLSGIEDTYTVYGGSTAGGTGTTLSNTTVHQPGPNSLACLSCHDGTIAIGLVYFGGGVSQSHPMTGGHLTADYRLDYAGYNSAGAYNPVIGDAISGSLTNDHPVAVTYDPNAAYVGLAAISAINPVLKLYQYPQLSRINSVECGTCHDPHKTTYTSFLKMPKEDLCQNCHAFK